MNGRISASTNARALCWTSRFSSVRVKSTMTACYAADRDAAGRPEDRRWGHTPADGCDRPTSRRPTASGTDIRGDARRRRDRSRSIRRGACASCRSRDEKFLAIAEMLADLVLEWAPPGAAVLDVGSGYGRLAIGLMGRGFDGRYEGFDILPRHIAWCRRHLTRFAPAYRFHHLDIQNDRYNPTGLLDPVTARVSGQGPRSTWLGVFSVLHPHGPAGRSPTTCAR